MNSGPQIEGLQSASTSIAIAKLLANRVQNGIEVADRSTNDEWNRLFESFTDALAAGYFAETDMTRVAFQNNNVAREKTDRARRRGSTTCCRVPQRG